MRERTDPRPLKKWLILAAIVYFIFPYDLFPDFLGLPGRIDDLLVMAGLAWFYRNRAQQFFAARRAAEAEGESAGRSANAGFRDGARPGTEAGAGSRSEWRSESRSGAESSWGSGAGSGAGSRARSGADDGQAFDAYAVLGVPRSASSDAIRAAYRARMQEYHPDKVAHLGEELQKLALEKSQQIQRAYQQLRR